MVARADLSLLICMVRTMALVSVGSLLNSPAGAQQAQRSEWCEGRGNPTYDQRINACTEIIGENSGTPEKLARAYGNRGVAYDNKSDAEHAAIDYDEAVRLDPDSASGHRIRGNAYQLKKEYDSAIAEYGEAIRLDPNDVLAHANRGRAYHEKKDYDRAIADASEAIKLDPSFVNAFYNRGLTYHFKRDPDHAIADFNEALRLDPKRPYTAIARGNAYGAKKEWDRAIADYTRAIGMEPVQQSAAYAYGGRCWARFVIGHDLRETFTDCTSALNLRPKDRWSAVARGFVYLKLGDFNRSRALKLDEFNRSKEDFDTALAIDPKTAMALYGRSLAERKSGNGPTADKDLEMARTIQADIAEVVAKYGVQ